MIKPSECKPAENLLTEFCQGYAKRDLPFLLGLFTKNTNVWGSGVDEYRVGHLQLTEQLNRDWSQSDTGSIHIIRWVPSNDNANWAAAVCQARITVAGEEHIFDDLRGTIIIEKEHGCWKIAHMHASFPDYRNPDNASFPVK
jgi:hypothetical protein